MTADKKYTITKVDVINESTGKAIDCNLESDFIFFTMPPDNVTVTAQCESVSDDSHCISVDSDSIDRLTLTDRTGAPLNITGLKADPGSAVYFKTAETIPVSAVKAYDPAHNSVPFKNEGAL